MPLYWDSEKEAVPDIITRRDNPFLNSTPRHEEEEDGEEEGEVQVTPNKQKDDLARRRAQSKPLPHRDGPVSFVSASMSQADMQKWERLKMTEPRCLTHTLSVSTHMQYRAENAAGCQVCGLRECAVGVCASISSSLKQMIAGRRDH